MKKVLTFLVTLVLVSFVGATLYVFELPPFQSGGPFFPAAEEKAPTQELTKQELPEFLTEDKVGRAKTYSEHMSRGKLLEENGYPALAVAEYEAAEKLSPDEMAPLLEIGRIHLRSKDYLKAKFSFEQALTIDPESQETKVYLGRTLLADRKITEAKKVFDSIEVHNQNSKYYLGLLAAYFGDYENSKNLLREGMSINTSQDITSKARNFLSAYDEYDFNQGGTAIHLKTLLSRSFNQTGEYQMAIPLLFEVIKEKKDYRDAWILLGYAYLNIEKYQDAIEAFEEAKKLDPQKAETLFFLGLSYYGLNDLNKAAQNLELAKKNGFEPQVQVNQKLAEIYLQLKEYEKAASNYENVLSLNNEDVEYFIKPIWIYLDRLQQPEKALTLAHKALAAHPNEAMSYNLLGWAYTGAGKLTEAEQNLNQALSLDPRLDAIYLNFGALNEKKGQYSQALSYFKKAYEMGSGNSISMAAADHYNKLIGKMDKVDYASLKVDLLSQ